MKAVIFDFDGVIHDTFELGRKILEKASGKEVSENRFRDFFDGNVFDTWEISDEQEDERFYEMQKEAFKYLEIDQNVKEKLELLAKKHHLFIVSSNQEINLKTYFQNNNSTHVFKQVLGMETHQSKVWKFNHIFEKYNLQSSDCVFVTDTLGDILESNKVGLKTIAVDYGFHQRERLEKGKPFKIVSSFDEVINVIEKI